MQDTKTLVVICIYAPYHDHHRHNVPNISRHTIPVSALKLGRKYWCLKTNFGSSTRIVVGKAYNQFSYSSSPHIILRTRNLGRPTKYVVLSGHWRRSNSIEFPVLAIKKFPLQSFYRDDSIGRRFFFIDRFTILYMPIADAFRTPRFRFTAGYGVSFLFRSCFVLVSSLSLSM